MRTKRRNKRYPKSFGMKALLCVNDDGAIGNKSELLYNIPEDMKRFKEETVGGLVIMGRKTHDSIVTMRGGKTLPDRQHIIISRETERTAPDLTLREVLIQVEDGVREIYVGNTEIVLELVEYLRTFDYDKSISVIGGAEIYRQLVPYCEEVKLTMVFDYGVEADTFVSPDLFDNHYTDETSLEEITTDEGIKVVFETMYHINKGTK